MDTLTEEQRSHCMSQIRSGNTKPELLVRSLIHRMGYRYRLHVRNLPGCPDLVFPARNKVIFVHGCFWHRHNCRVGRFTPTSNESYWIQKLEGNRDRDRRNRRKLKRLGWQMLVVWECELDDLEAAAARFTAFLDRDGGKKREKGSRLVV